MFSLTIQDNHLSCRKQLRESSQLPEVLQKVREFMCLVYETKLRQPDGCRFRFSAGDRAAAQPDFPIPPAPLTCTPKVRQNFMGLCLE